MCPSCFVAVFKVLFAFSRFFLAVLEWDRKSLASILLGDLRLSRGLRPSDFSIGLLALLTWVLRPHEGVALCVLSAALFLNKAPGWLVLFQSSGCFGVMC